MTPDPVMAAFLDAALLCSLHLGFLGEWWPGAAVPSQLLGGAVV